MCNPFYCAQAINCSRVPGVIYNEDSPPEPLASTFGYSAIKRAAEALVQEYVRDGLPAVILNPAEVYGPNDTGLVTAGNLKTMICDWPVIIPSTGGTAVCHVEDVAAAAAAAVTKGRPGQRYVLGGPCLTVRELAELTLELAGGKCKRTPVLALPSRLLVAVVGLLAVLGLPTPVEPGVLKMAVMYWCARVAALSHSARAALLR